MGQRSKLKTINWRTLRQVSRGWVLPVLLTLAILFGIHATVKADPPPSETELATYLQTKPLYLDNEVVNGYQQLFYVYNNQEVQLTYDNYDHFNAVSSGPYVAWEGSIDAGPAQIYQYNVLTGALTQITLTGTNIDPSVSGDTITWDWWDGSNWQVMYYNGQQVQQITSDNHSSVHASTDGSDIIYAEQLGADEWEAQEYDITSGQTTTISTGDTANTAYPEFGSNGTINTAYNPY